MKLLKFSIVFLSCFLLFIVSATANEDIDDEVPADTLNEAVVDSEGVVDGLSEEDELEFDSALDALEELYGDQDVTIIVRKSVHQPAPADDEKAADEGVQGTCEQGMNDDEQSYRSDDTEIGSSVSGVNGIEITIIKNDEQENQLQSDQIDDSDSQPLLTRGDRMRLWNLSISCRQACIGLSHWPCRAKKKCPPWLFNTARIAARLNPRDLKRMFCRTLERSTMEKKKSGCRIIDCTPCRIYPANW